MDLRALVAAESVLRDREPVVVVVVSVVTRVAMSGVDVVNVIAVGDRDVPAAVAVNVGGVPSRRAGSFSAMACQRCSLSSHGIQPLVDRSLQLQRLRPAISTVAGPRGWRWTM
ncbi:hypothetical protein ACFYTS_34145 [Nocardia sp. NPDC004151]|uniref:hypothetical protein n=1 Tax=Nocardia sp. NPDC004151 TaxID=3364304 RepID=UPI0036BF71F3